MDRPFIEAAGLGSLVRAHTVSLVAPFRRRQTLSSASVKDDLGRIEEFLRWAWDSSSTRIEASEFGTALFNDRFPSYWDGTLLRVERPDGASAAELIAEADRLFSGFGHREIVVFDDVEGARFAPAFRQAGWEVDRLVFMAARRAADRGSAMAVDEADFAEVAPLLVETNLHGHGGMTPAAAEANAAVRQMLVDIVGVRFFVARLDGVPAGVSELLAHEGVAEIDNVNTLERYRGRGIASALVDRAVREGRDGGADLVFLIADDADWPKQLYAKLGFDPVGWYWQFTRPPAGESYR
jgi:ribosomal protein S18 acetylase RimI-like enzyme